MKWHVSTLGLVSLALGAGCGEYGDRAVDGCPTDEVCDPTTPQGLVFYGTGTVATGGATTVTFAHANYVRGADGVSRHPAFEQPFVATVDDEAIMHIAAQGTARVDLRANAVGEARLRIEAFDGQLFDRLTIKTEKIAYATVLGDGLIAVAPATPIAFATGTVSLSVGLFGSTGTRLIDSAAQVSADVPMRPVPSKAQHYEFEAMQPQRVTVNVKAGDRAALELPLDVVASIDRVATTEPSYAVAAQDGSAMVCFAGYHDVRAVANLAWIFTVDGVIQAKNLVENCMFVAITASHIPVLEATARGITGRARIVVTAAPKSSRSTTVADEVAGDRAVGNAAENAADVTAEISAENAKPPAEASGARTQLVKN